MHGLREGQGAMITILNPPTLEKNPSVIVRTSEPSEAFMAENTVMLGEFARVVVKTAKDWQFVLMLRHGIDYFAPTNGNGLLVRAELLKAR